MDMPEPTLNDLVREIADEQAECRAALREALRRHRRACQLMQKGLALFGPAFGIENGVMAASFAPKDD